MNVMIGTNIISHCDAVLTIEGEEVFRLRNRDSDGRLVCDFDLRTEDGKRLAKIASNNVVFVADGLSYKNDSRSSSVVDQSGKVIAEVVELRTNTLKIIGNFNVAGLSVSVTETELKYGNSIISGNIMQGCGGGIGISRGGISLG